MSLSARSVVRGALPIDDGSLGQPGFAQVMSENLRLAGDRFRVGCLDAVRDLRVELDGT